MKFVLFPATDLLVRNIDFLKDDFIESFKNRSKLKIINHTSSQLTKSIIQTFYKTSVSKVQKDSLKNQIYKQMTSFRTIPKINF